MFIGGCFLKIQSDSSTEENEEVSSEKGDGLIAIHKCFVSSWLVEKERSGFLKEFIAHTKVLLELFWKSFFILFYCYEMWMNLGYI